MGSAAEDEPKAGDFVVGSESSRLQLLFEMQDHSGIRKVLNSELWHACAGPLVSLPPVGSFVYYFPQGHLEQVAAYTKSSSHSQIPCYPSQLMCQVHNVTLHADKDTDEMYAQMSLQPVSSEKNVLPAPSFGIMSSMHPTEYFCKVLTASDTSTHGGFSVPRRSAEKIFPPLDYTSQRPSQELVVQDLYDNTWTFRHTYRGQPKRHLLTTGWSLFIWSKRLKTSDSVIFIRDERSQLLIGVRRADPQEASVPSSFISADSIHLSVLAAAAHAATNRSCFTVSYNPRLCPSEFVIPLTKYRKALYETEISVGMRFGTLFETQDSRKRRFMGTIVSISELDPIRWPGSKWRNIQVKWDVPGNGKQRRLSAWEIDTPGNTFIFPSPSSTVKRKLPPGMLAPGTNGNGLQLVEGRPAPMNSSPTMMNETEKLLPLKTLQHQKRNRRNGVDLNPGTEHSTDLLRQLITEAESNKETFSMSFASTQPFISQSTFLDQHQSPWHSHPNLLHVPAWTQVDGTGLCAFRPCLNTGEWTSNVLSCQTLPSMHGFPGPLKIVGPQGSMAIFPEAINPWLVPEACQLPSLLCQGPCTLNSGELSNESGVYSCVNTDTCNASSRVVDPSVSSAALDDYYIFKDVDFNTNSLINNFSYPQDFQPHTSISSICTSSSNVELESGLQCQLMALGLRRYTKVEKTGSLGRPIDVTSFNSYGELISAIESMFGLKSLLGDSRGSGWKLVYVDYENDVLLMGADPWEEFVGCVRCIRVLSPKEVQEMSEEGMKLLNHATAQGISSCTARGGRSSGGKI